MSKKNSIAFILTLIVTAIAVFRPLNLGSDTKQYIEVLNSYRSNDTAEFPDLIFAAYTWIFTRTFESGEFTNRLYLSIISVFQGYLFFNIIKNKSPIEGLIFSAGYAPLIFFDIIRQGVSMLLVGYYLTVKRKNFFVFLALSTHINALVIFLKVDFYKNNKKYLLLLIGLCSLLIFIMWDGLEGRFIHYYYYSEYLSVNKSGIEILDIVSISNMMVIIFLLYSLILGKFSSYESSILIALYLLSIFFPIFFRIYFFYFFLISCSKDYVKLNKSNNDIVFNISYIVIVLNFSTKL